MEIHAFARAGNIEGVTQQLAQGVPIDLPDDREHYTPLMHAVESPSASLEMVRFLIQEGADVNYSGELRNVLGTAVGAGDFEKIQLLLDAGADLHYEREGGYDILIDAMHGPVSWQDKDIISLLKFLVGKGAKTTGMSEYGESALSVASRVGRFDVVRLLLELGADAEQTEWTPLMQAIALGSLQDVEQALTTDADLSARDDWSRTPWLLSIHTGDVEKARLLLAAGADRSEVGRCGKTPLMYAIESEQVAMLAWLLEEGFDIEATDEFGATPLQEAVENEAIECVRFLIEAGATLRATNTREGNIIEKAQTVEIARILLEAGQDINDISDTVRALLTGVEDPDEPGEIEASREDYLLAKHLRPGTTNPELMNFKFWQAMVKSGATAYDAREKFGDTENQDEGPVWCFHRFGKSITELPDGRFIEIAGEHEDFYDPDFAIYNDVIVHHGGGRFDIYGYPEAVFPPTDFHSATLVGEYIYIIGSLGYPDRRKYRETPVYRLHWQTFVIEKVNTTGTNPGWIHRHKVVCKNETELHLTGGGIFKKSPRFGRGARQERWADNNRLYILDLTQMHWSCTRS